MSQTLLDRYIAVERGLYPKAGYRFKDEVLLHKVIAFYMRPFNHRYLDGFTTTMYPNTDFPSIRREQPDDRMFQTEVHENVHKWDRWHEGRKWSLKYVYPQILAAPFLAAAVALGGLFGWLGFAALLLLLHVGLLACHLSRGEDGRPASGAKVAFFILTALGAAAAVGGSIYSGRWWAFLWLGAPLFISPWPFRAVWRRDAELRGYTASLYYAWLTTGQVWSGLVDHIVSNFTGGNYFWMETRRQLVYDELQFQIERFKSNEPAFLAAWGWRRRRGWHSPKMAEPFRMMRSFMFKEGLLHDQA